MKEGNKKSVVKTFIIFVLAISMVLPFAACKSKTEASDGSGSADASQDDWNVIEQMFTVDRDGVLGVIDKYKLTDEQKKIEEYYIHANESPVTGLDRKMMLFYIFMNFADGSEVIPGSDGLPGEVTEEMIQTNLSKWYKETKKLNPAGMSLNDLFKAKTQYMFENYSEKTDINSIGKVEPCTFDEYLAKINPDVPSLPETVEIPSEINGVAVTEIPSELFSSYNFTKTVSVVLSDPIVKIDSKAFYNMTTLKTINLPDSIISIGEEAFENCFSLESITVPSKMKAISDSTFFNCVSLVTVNGLDHVEDIGGNAFFNCKKLVINEVPSSIQRIGIGAFLDCGSLNSVVFNKLREIEKKSFDDTTSKNADWLDNISGKISYDNLYMKDNMELFGKLSKISAKTLIMPESVDSLDCNALNGVNAENIVFPDNFTVGTFMSSSEKYSTEYIYINSLATKLALTSITMPCGYKYKLYPGNDLATPPARLASVTITAGKTGVFEELDADMTTGSVLNVEYGVTILNNCYNYVDPNPSYNAHPASVINLPDGFTLITGSFNNISDVIVINAPSGMKISDSFNNSPNITVNYR